MPVMWDEDKNTDPEDMTCLLNQQWRKTTY